MLLLTRLGLHYALRLRVSLTRLGLHYALGLRVSLTRLVCITPLVCVYL
jgi:hypothetical protein